MRYYNEREGDLSGSALWRMVRLDPDKLEPKSGLLERERKRERQTDRQKQRKRPEWIRIVENGEAGAARDKEWIVGAKEREIERDRNRERDLNGSALWRMVRLDPEELDPKSGLLEPKREREIIT